MGRRQHSAKDHESGRHNSKIARKQGTPHGHPASVSSRESSTPPSDGGGARSGAPKSQCTTVGHPVDVATGSVFCEVNDAPWPCPCTFERQWHSSSTYRGPLGRGWRHEYDLVAHVRGGQLALDLPDDRRVNLPLPPSGGTSSHEGAKVRARSSGGALEIELGDGARYRLAPTGRRDGALSAVRKVTADGSVLELAHDADGRLVAIRADLGELLLEYDGQSRVSTLSVRSELTGAMERLAVYRYDETGNLVSAAGRSAKGPRYEYDGHLMTKEVDATGFAFHFAWDGRDESARCRRTWGDGGLFVRELSYGPEPRVTHVRDGAGRTERHEQDTAGRVTATTIGGVTTREEWDETGNLTARIDGAGNRTTYRYDAATGRLTEVAHPDGEQLRAVFEGESLIALVGPLGAFERCRDVDQEQTLFATRSPSRHCYLLDRRGLPARTPDPRFGAAPDSPLEWHHGSLLPRERLAERQVARAFPRDLLLHAARHPVPRLRAAASECLEAASPGGARLRWDFDENGLEIAHRDADGRTYRTERVWRLPARETDPLGLVTSYHHGTTDRLERVTDPLGSATEYSYDERGRVAEVRRFGQVRDRYTYDAADELVEKRDGEGRLLFRRERDLAGRSETLHLASGRSLRLCSDLRGRPVTAELDGATTRLDHDEAGNRIQDETDGRGTRHRTAGGRVTSTTILGRFTTGYDRSKSGGLTITDPTGASHHLAFSDDGTVSRTTSNGTVEVARHGEHGRCLRKAVTLPGRRSWTRYYTYSEAGDLLEERHENPPALGQTAAAPWFSTTRYQYDAAHRLTRAEPDGGAAETFHHDDAGNLLLQPGLSDVVLQNGNQLVAARGFELSYDARHHVSVCRRGEKLSFHDHDELDWLVRIRRDQETLTFRYDALGRRVEKRAGEGATRYLWDNHRLAAELSPDGHLRVYVYDDIDALVPFLLVDYASETAAPSSGRRLFLRTNALGAPVLAEDDHGEVVWAARIEPYGRAHVHPSSKEHISLRFPGHHHDDETSLHYNRFRHYSPDLGRYFESDPIGISGGANVHAYPHNPLREVDLFGLNGCGDWLDEKSRQVGRAVSGFFAPLTEPVRHSPPGRLIWGDDRAPVGGTVTLVDHMPPMRTQLFKPWAGSVTVIGTIANLNCGWYCTKALLHHWRMRLDPQGHDHRVALPGWRHRLIHAFEPDDHLPGDLRGFWQVEHAAGMDADDVKALLDAHGPLLACGTLGLANWGYEPISPTHFVLIVGVDTGHPPRIAYKDPLNPIDRVTWSNLDEVGHLIDRYTYLTDPEGFFAALDA